MDADYESKWHQASVPFQPLSWCPTIPLHCPTLVQEKELGGEQTEPAESETQPDFFGNSFYLENDSVGLSLRHFCWNRLGHSLFLPIKEKAEMGQSSTTLALFLEAWSASSYGGGKRHYNFLQLVGIIIRTKAYKPELRRQQQITNSTLQRSWRNNGLPS